MTLSLALMRGGFRLLGKTSPGIASRVAETLFTRPRRFAPPPREVNAMDGAEELAIPFEGMMLRAWRWNGGGKVVLLVHGWEGRGSQMTPFVAPLLDQRMSIVALDGPAHGRSHGTRTTLPQFAAAVRAVAEFVGPVEGIIAHSFGCAATTLAIHDDLEAARLVFVAPPVDPASYTRAFSAFFRVDEAVMERMRRRIERRFHRRWSDFSVGRMAVKMRAPLLVFHDADDEEIPLAESETIVRAWPSSRLVVTNGLGHRRILRDEAVTRAAAAFLAARVS